MTPLLVFVFLAQGPTKQDVLWEKMTAHVGEIAKSSDGVMGVALRDLTDGREFGHLADQAFPTASTIKIAALVELYKQNRLDELYVVEKADLVGGSGLMGDSRPV
jgi:beta-lactamase class A